MSESKEDVSESSESGIAFILGGSRGRPAAAKLAYLSELKLKGIWFVDNADPSMIDESTDSKFGDLVSAGQSVHAQSGVFEGKPFDHTSVAITSLKDKATGDDYVILNNTQQLLDSVIKSISGDAGSDSKSSAPDELHPDPTPAADNQPSVNAPDIPPVEEKHSAIAADVKSAPMVNRTTSPPTLSLLTKKSDEMMSSTAPSQPVPVSTISGDVGSTLMQRSNRDLGGVLFESTSISAGYDSDLPEVKATSAPTTTGFDLFIPDPFLFVSDLVDSGCEVKYTSSFEPVNLFNVHSSHTSYEVYIDEKETRVGGVSDDMYSKLLDYWGINRVNCEFSAEAQQFIFRRCALFDNHCHGHYYVPTFRTSADATFVSCSNPECNGRVYIDHRDAQKAHIHLYQYRCQDRLIQPFIPGCFFEHQPYLLPTTGRDSDAIIKLMKSWAFYIPRVHLRYDTAEFVNYETVQNLRKKVWFRNVPDHNLSKRILLQTTEHVPVSTTEIRLGNNVLVKTTKRGVINGMLNMAKMDWLSEEAERLPRLLTQSANITIDHNVIDETSLMRGTANASRLRSVTYPVNTQWGLPLSSIPEPIRQAPREFYERAFRSVSPLTQSVSCGFTVDASDQPRSLNLQDLFDLLYVRGAYVIPPSHYRLRSSDHGISIPEYSSLAVLCIFGALDYKVFEAYGAWEGVDPQAHLRSRKVRDGDVQAYKTMVRVVIDGINVEVKNIIDTTLPALSTASNRDSLLSLSRSFCKLYRVFSHLDHDSGAIRATAQDDLVRQFFLFDMQKLYFIMRTIVANSPVALYISQAQTCIHADQLTDLTRETYMAARVPIRQLPLLGGLFSAKLGYDTVSCVYYDLDIDYKRIIDMNYGETQLRRLVRLYCHFFTRVHTDVIATHVGLGIYEADQKYGTLAEVVSAFRDIISLSEASFRSAFPRFAKHTPAILDYIVCDYNQAIHPAVALSSPFDDAWISFNIDGKSSLDRKGEIAWVANSYIRRYCGNTPSNIAAYFDLIGDTLSSRHPRSLASIARSPDDLELKQNYRAIVSDYPFEFSVIQDSKGVFEVIPDFPHTAYQVSFPCDSAVSISTPSVGSCNSLFQTTFKHGRQHLDKFVNPSLVDAPLSLYFVTPVACDTPEVLINRSCGFDQVASVFDNKAHTNNEYARRHFKETSAHPQKLKKVHFPEITDITSSCTYTNGVVHITNPQVAIAGRFRAVNGVALIPFGPSLHTPGSFKDRVAFRYDKDGKFDEPSNRRQFSSRRLLGGTVVTAVPTRSSGPMPTDLGSSFQVMAALRSCPGIDQTSRALYQQHLHWRTARVLGRVSTQQSVLRHSPHTPLVTADYTLEPAVYQ
jgi:hypothetical protein